MEMMRLETRRPNRRWCLEMLSPELRLWKWELRKEDRVEILHGYLISLDKISLHWSPDWEWLGDYVNSYAIFWYRCFKKGSFGRKDNKYAFEPIEWEESLRKSGIDLVTWIDSAVFLFVFIFDWWGNYGSVKLFEWPEWKKWEQEEIRLVLNPGLLHSVISLLSVQLLENSNAYDECQLPSLSWPS